MRIFGRSSESDGRPIVFGLGNPGDRYARTRHNAGAMVVDELLSRTGSALKRHKTGALTAEVSLAGRRVVLGRSTGYMNESGGPLQQLARWYKTEPEQLVVVHDELDIPFGEVRVKAGGGTAGHNGLGSIANRLGTKEFVRVRVGIGRPSGPQDAKDYVLQPFSAAERKEVPMLIAEAADAVERILEVGVDRAMNEVNTRA